MLGVLVVVLGGNGIAGRARVARELDVFFGDMRCGAADLDIGSVGLKTRVIGFCPRRLLLLLLLLLLFRLRIRLLF